MILFITPNPCIERTYLIDKFSCGEVHRVSAPKVLLNAGGKGINAARVARQFTAKVLSLSWAGNAQSMWFHEQLQRENVPHELIELVAETRTCINILRAGQPKTEIVEAGAPLSAELGALLIDHLKVLLPKVSLIAVCGSYPPAQPAGVLENNLQQIAQLAKEYDVPLLVDGKGKSFAQLLKSRLPVWAIKPNTDEAAEILGYPICTPNEELAAVKVLLGYSVQNVILSCGKRGAYLGNNDGIYFFPAPQITEISAVGSGDSLVGAFCAQWTINHDIHQAMRWGIAAGAANAMQQKSAFCTKEDMEKVMECRTLE